MPRNVVMDLDIEEGPKAMDPVAISGMSCRLPGNVNNTNELWNLLIEGRSGQGDIPPTRFNKDAYHHQNPEHTGTINGTGGYFLENDVRLFDNNFFGINNLEAKYMDPQQRQLLEVVYECLENAGESLDSVSGANIGCYVANFTVDYSIMQAQDPDLYHRYSATGFGPTILANRISHLFNLKGPSFVLDTACSSALYALHVACTAIMAGDCDAAIVAGANLVQSPEVFIAMAKAGVLSATSTSHTFDSSADGYGRGEGVAALYIQRLDRALLKNDPVRSVIRGTAINSNGNTPGITLPGVLGQEAVIRKAYAAARLRMEDTLYVEAHGTGTPVGDPIEINALSNAFNTISRPTLLIGSNKPNVGHGEAVSGLTSIIKATLALEHHLIPPTRGIKELSPNLKLRERNIDVVQTALSWPAGSNERISVNAFGYGGANAHAIIDSAAMHIPKQEQLDHVPVESTKSVLLPFSAHHPNSLATNMEAVTKLELLRTELMDLSHTLATRRSRLAHRSYMIGMISDSGVQFSTNPVQPSSSSSESNLGFVFTGQGAQWPGMGKDLMGRFPIYEHTIDDLDAYLSTFNEAPSWTIRRTLLDAAQAETIYKASRSQTVCTAVQIALVLLLKDWGIQPTSVVGHSSGEIGAAFAAGHVSAREALAIAYYRGLVSEKIPREGAMIAVGMGAKQTAELISSLGVQDAAKIACVNSPESTTVSGEPSGVDEVFIALQQRKVFSRKLKTDGKAYHSHLMQLVGDEYGRHLTSVLLPGSPVISSKIQMFSSVTAQPTSRAEVRSPSYWRMNLESPVLFLDAVSLLVSTDSHHLVEIGPHPALGQPIRDIINSLPGQTLHYSSSLYRGKSGETCMLHLAGQLYMAGKDIIFSNINDSDIPEVSAQLLSVPVSDYDTQSIHSAHDSGVEDLEERVNPRRYLARKASQLLFGKGVIGTENTRIDSNISTAVRTTIASDRVDSLDQAHVMRSRFAGGQPKYQSRVLTKLPPYAWDRQAPLWIESRHSSEKRNTQYKKHDLLGSRIPATPGNLAIWRNQLKLSEVPWVQDHRLGSTIVFPGAGYFAMGIEALLQVCDRPGKGSIVLRDVHLTNMMVLSGEEKDAIEVSTVLEPIQLSQTSSSDLWWKFQISSFASKTFTAHASGSIAWKPDASVLDSKFKLPVKFGPEEQAVRTMYNRLSSQGLCFGPQFKSMKSILTDRHRELAFASAETEFRKGGGQGKTAESQYVIHPITIDSLLQTAIVASCKGASNDLYGKVPVQIDALEMLIDDLPTTSSTCTIRANSESVGFDAVLLGGELLDEAQRIIANIQGVRAINYRETSLAPKSTLQRNPALRVLWKPDISMISSSSSATLRSYAERFRRYLPSKWATSGTNAHLAAMLDLLTHKSGRMSILEIAEANDDRFSDLVQKLSLSHAPRRYQSYTRGKIDETGNVRVLGTNQTAKSSSFDLVIITSPGNLLKGFQERLVELLSADGMLLLAGPKSGETALSSDIFNSISILPYGSSSSITIGRKLQPDRHKSSLYGPFIIVHDGSSDVLNDAIAANIQTCFKTYTRRIHFDDLTEEHIPQTSIVISTLEFATPFLSTMDQKQQLAVTTLAENASILLWITAGELFKSQDPEAASILGLARSLMLERPALRMPVLDLEKGLPNVTRTGHNVMQILEEVLEKSIPDFEFRERKGALYISRFIPDIARNQAFVRAQDAEKVEMRVGDVGHAKLNMKVVGQIDTLRFEQTPNPSEIQAGHVRVEVQAVGMNAKDLYALSDRINISGSTCGLEFSGCITAVGPSVSKFIPGDRVVVMAPHHYSTVQDIPEWACCKLKNQEDSTVMATVPLVFSTALYALEHRARMEDGQSILIHSGAGGLGIAAIQVAQMLGVEIYTTVGTQEKREFLIDHFSIPDDHIFDSHSTSFLKDLLHATSGRGVDCVLNSLTGDMLHASWEALAPFGTFVEVGKRDIADGGKLNMRVFDRAATFTAFDLTDLFWESSKQRVWSKLLHRSINLIRSGHVKVIAPLKIFPASEIVQAFRYFSSSKRMGKVAISFEKNKTIPVVPFKYQTKFHTEKSYLLVGCLGGLGRSISRWMFSLGARHFTFISRSGVERPSAAKLVADLESAGACVTVCKGSVTDRAIVQEAVDSSSRPIGGVIQASMAIHVALFKEMENATWHAGLSQKIQGTWNLHHALEGRDRQLDFFLMLSSITGSVGTATESNYCAANSFLDAFGSYRRSLGLPAVALGLGMISEVGFLHENPETEAVLLRKGVHPFTEAELLQIIDLSITEFPSEPTAAIDNGFGGEHEIEGHILTGLELHGFQKIRDQGFVRGTKVLEDPRCTYIAGAFAESGDSADADQTSSSSSLPHAIRVALVENANSSEPLPVLNDAVQVTIVKQISSLLLVSTDTLQKDTFLADFGMESMLAAELRSDIYRTFNTDVPFALLLDKRTQIQTVTQTIGRCLLQQDN